MPPPAEPFTTGLVLAAGGSRRLGRPKQLLPYGKGTLLEHVVGVAAGCGFDQLVVALGGAADEVRAAVDLGGADVVVNPDYDEGCSSSIASAMSALHPACGVLVLLLGDQPGISPAAVGAVRTAVATAPMAVCRYDDGRGHPFAFGRTLFDELRSLHGDKAVWRLLDQHHDEVVDVPVAGPVPRDVDTWDDYEAVLAAGAP